MHSKKNMVIISIAVIIGILFLIAAKTSGSKTGGGNTDFMSTFAHAENAVLVDVRTPEEYAEGHIANAVNINFYDPAFVEKMKALGTDKKFFIYCRSGNRSGQALRALAGAGLTAQHLEGGIGSHPELLR